MGSRAEIELLSNMSPEKLAGLARSTGGVATLTEGYAAAYWNNDGVVGTIMEMPDGSRSLADVSGRGLLREWGPLVSHLAVVQRPGRTDRVALVMPSSSDETRVELFRVTDGRMGHFQRRQLGPRTPLRRAAALAHSSLLSR